MKITITHANVKVEYLDENKTPSEYVVRDVINALGQVTKILKDEAEKKDRGASVVPRDMGVTTT